jgi:hypothetical protein
VVFGLGLEQPHRHQQQVQRDRDDQAGAARPLLSVGDHFVPGQGLAAMCAHIAVVCREMGMIVAQNGYNL